jgi:hypothetical protein
MDRFAPTNSIFQALLKEAELTKEMLAAGATQIRLANYAKKGVYFQAFTSLATGLERVGKLCLMLDYYIDNNGKFPEFQYLKKDIGHNLLKLYEKSVELAKRRNIAFDFLPDLSSEIHQHILQILSQFAEGDRYSNINLLVGSKQINDPISAWANEVDTRLYQQRVSQKKKKAIEERAHVTAQVLSNAMSVWHLGEDGTEIRDVHAGSLRTGIYEAVVPYRQLVVLQIIRYWSELLNHLESEARSLGKQEIPFFFEILAWFCNSDSMLRTKKIWN